jgi:hypothetical protein
VQRTGAWFTFLLVLPLAVGCCEEWDKVRGRSSRGTSSAKSELPRQRFTLDTGDAFITAPALRAVRNRLKAPGVAGSSASLVGTAVQVDVPGDKSDAVAEALRGARLDVHAGDDLLIRGESLSRADVGPNGLVLVFERAAKSSLARAVDEERLLRVEIDGTMLSELESDQAGRLTLNMDAGRAERLAKRLTGLALSHRTKLEQKAIK